MGSRGFAGLFGLVITVALLGLLAYFYYATQKEGGASFLGRQMQAVEEAEEMKDALETRSQMWDESI
ncbi:hypothetical protein A2853_01160 [Candidatus Kaiserbacteria bacterium RIFCSPHIGHO2_01_FULL_55_17]|uniref:Uncharacterized protein n=1 Tax=Candidatus Kaiserbacteria bacterium RIFCSPHIGHO2_01_FULL_55_17 TaxID=1798484 RepID=A0A1F6D9G7_9BACT|nr:MAG: hypothetical protein A2853_01160 [Candidatus Kaiserbacteria bacterium RIFCSPHIGHO2_01_FULL_55_17]